MNGKEWAHEIKVREFLKSASQRQERQDRKNAKREAERPEPSVVVSDDAAQRAEAHLTAIGFTLVAHVKRFDYELL